MIMHHDDDALQDYGLYNILIKLTFLCYYIIYMMWVWYSRENTRKSPLQLASDKNNFHYIMTISLLTKTMYGVCIVGFAL